MAVEFLLAAVAGRRRLIGRLKPAASGTRRSNQTTSTAAGDGTRGTGTDLRAATCGRRWAVKIKKLKSPAATAAVISLPIASLHRGGTGCRRAGSVPISPAALGHLARIGGRRVAKKVVKPEATQHATTTGGRREVKRVVNLAATRHAKTTGGRREVTQVVKPAASRDPTTRGSDERDELIGHLALRFTSRLEHAIARWYLQYQNGPINGHVLLLMSVEDVISFYRCPIVARESSQEWPTSTLRCPPVQRGRTVVLSGRLAVFRVPGCCDEAAPQ